ncbi:hypothetical protein P7K49_026617 [Saguinus oedipus]|uniref:Uncharacterized protein n=1 Tax=Saguinus oedipus TaxID=9490 RepID=A0ABQ9UDT1_SAGOE|nr:hypothetical protein P7K49_026617 [Saguinus oedipus]
MLQRSGAVRSPAPRGTDRSLSPLGWGRMGGNGKRRVCGTRSQGSPPAGRRSDPAPPARPRPGPAPPARGASWVRGRGGGGLFKRRPRPRRQSSAAPRAPSPAPAGMAALLTPGPPPDEQDFIQAYEEVREKYKGMPPAPGLRTAPPIGTLSTVAATQPSSSSWLVPREGGGRAPLSPRGHALNRASRGSGGWGGPRAGRLSEPGFGGRG